MLHAMCLPRHHETVNQNTIWDLEIVTEREGGGRARGEEVCLCTSASASFPPLISANPGRYIGRYWDFKDVMAIPGRYIKTLILAI